MAKLAKLISIVHYQNDGVDNYEAFFSYYPGELFDSSTEVQYGIVTTHKELSVADLSNLNNFKIHHVNSFDNIYKNYTLNDKQRHISTNSGTLIITDDNSYLYCRNPHDVYKDIITINAGTKQVPELEKIEVTRYDPLIGIYTSNGFFEIYKLRDGVSLKYTSVAN